MCLLAPSSLFKDAMIITTSFWVLNSNSLDWTTPSHTCTRTDGDCMLDLHRFWRATRKQHKGAATASIFKASLWVSTCCPSCLQAADSAHCASMYGVTHSVYDSTIPLCQQPADAQHFIFCW